MIELMVTFSKRTYATCHISQDCCCQSPCPRNRPLLTHASQTLTERAGSFSCGGLSLRWGHCSFPWVLMPQGFVCALQVSLVGMRFDFTCDCVPPTILLQLFLCPWVWGIFFSEFQHPPVDVWSVASCNFGVPTGDQHTSFYSTILVYRLNTYN